LILLEALCENLEICFESNDMMQGIVNRQKLLERLDAIYLTEENIVGKLSSVEKRIRVS
jgi:hypothetical protein